MKQAILAAALVFTAQVSAAQQVVTYTTDQSFDDVVFGLESAIIDAGLVVDSTSKVGEMLERTREDIGSDVVIFTNAEVYSFCSAKVSRAVMEADPMNIVFCPYDIFVAVVPDKPDQTVIGFRQYPEGAMQQVQTMLDGIVKAALDE
jgi:uncharacterized protein (DUF302 family)